MNNYQKILTVVALVAFSAIIAPKANAWIGETREQVVADARRDSDTARVDNWGSAAIIVLYRDGSDINHVFGSNGREIAFILFSAKRLSAVDVKRIQRTYGSRWEATGVVDGLATWKLRGRGLYMGTTRLENYDKVSIFDSTKLEEVQQRTPRSAPERATATYPPPQQPYVAPQMPTVSSGTGFFIADDGYLITNEHVAGSQAQVRLATSAGLISAKVVKVDAANDLALLKAEGKFAALPVAASRSMKLGGTVATVGFPNIGLQGFAPKFARGEIGSLSGLQDDARFFQISVPVQPGNSGSALVDERGNVVGVVSGKLNPKATPFTPENVNYAVKSSFLLAFLESVPEVAAKLKEPNAKDMKFDDVVEQAKEAAVLVLVY